MSSWDMAPYFKYLFVIFAFPLSLIYGLNLLSFYIITRHFRMFFDKVHNSASLCIVVLEVAHKYITVFKYHKSFAISQIAIELTNKNRPSIFDWFFNLWKSRFCKFDWNWLVFEFVEQNWCAISLWRIKQTPTAMF